MTHDTTPPAPIPGTAHGTLLSRRSLLLGVGVGTASLMVAGAAGSVGAVAGLVNDSGRALAPAQRVTTTTTTVPAPTGGIRFPIVVGPDDACYVGRNFGACRGSGCSRSHEGVDIMADQGLPVIAVVDGELTKKYEDSGWSTGAGNGWTLTDDANDVVYKFFHLDSHADGLEVGDMVTAGQVLGYVGETGTSGANSTLENFHLHFEYRPNNIPRDSFDLLQRPEHVGFAS